MLDLLKTAERYRRELAESIIPFWVRHAPDLKRGGFFTCLGRDGAVLDPNKQLWIMWRNIYMLAKMYNVGLGGEECAELAQSGFEFCMRSRRPDGYYPLMVDVDGKPCTDVGSISAMENAYAVMACAELFRLEPKSEYRTEGFSSLRLFYERMGSGESGRMLVFTRAKLLGEYMHLVRMAGDLLTACGDEAGYCRGLIEESLQEIPKFRHPELRRWLEVRRQDGSFGLDSMGGRIVRVGHGFETMWYAGLSAEAIGAQEFLSKIPDWIREMCTYAFDRTHGGLLQLVDALDQPTCVEGVGWKTWWVHTEGLLGLVYAYRLSHEAWFMEQFEQLDQWVWSHFRDPEYPEWYAVLAPNGEPLCEAKGTPLKAFFHLPHCLWFGSKWLREVADSGEKA